MQLHLTRLDFGEIEDLLDQAQQVLARAFDLRQIRHRRRFPPIERVLLQQLAVADDGIQRRPELVAHVRHERALGPIRRFGGVLRRSQLLLGLSTIARPNREGREVGQRAGEMLIVDRPVPTRPEVRERDDAHDLRAKPDRCVQHRERALAVLLGRAELPSSLNREVSIRRDDALPVERGEEPR